MNKKIQKLHSQTKLIVNLSTLSFISILLIIYIWGYIKHRNLYLKKFEMNVESKFETI